MRKRSKDPKCKMVTVRLTKSEFEEVCQNADICGLSISAFVRRKSTGGHVTAKTDYKNLAELRRIGGLLKHVHNESKGAYSERTAKAISDISAFVRKLGRELDSRRVSAK